MCENCKVPVNFDFNQLSETLCRLMNDVRNLKYEVKERDEEITDLKSRVWDLEQQTKKSTKPVKRYMTDYHATGYDAEPTIINGRDE